MTPVEPRFPLDSQPSGSISSIPRCGTRAELVSASGRNAPGSPQVQEARLSKSVGSRLGIGGSGAGPDCRGAKLECALESIIWTLRVLLRSMNWPRSHVRGPLSVVSRSLLVDRGSGERTGAKLECALESIIWRLRVLLRSMNWPWSHIRGPLPVVSRSLLVDRGSGERTGAKLECALESIIWRLRVLCLTRNWRGSRDNRPRTTYNRQSYENSGDQLRQFFAEVSVD